MALKRPLIIEFHYSPLEEMFGIRLCCFNLEQSDQLLLFNAGKQLNKNKHHFCEWRTWFENLKLNLFWSVADNILNIRGHGHAVTASHSVECCFKNDRRIFSEINFH